MFKPLALLTLAVAASANASVFSETFDSYGAGSQMHGQGGWKGWDNLVGAGAYVSTARAFSGGSSVLITGGSDLVHEHAITTGAYSYTAKQWIDTGAGGVSYFILMNKYADGGNSDWQSWSSQLKIDMGAGVIYDDLRSGSARVALKKGQWADIRVDIDLDNDTMASYYDGTLIYSGSWTQGSRSARQIAAIDLYAGSGSSYYDNVSIDAIPAPSAASLMLLGVSVACGRGRRSSRRG